MRRDLAQITFGVLFIVTLIVASFWIMRAFIVPIIWAATTAPLNGTPWKGSRQTAS